MREQSLLNEQLEVLAPPGSRPGSDGWLGHLSFWVIILVISEDGDENPNSQEFNGSKVKKGEFIDNQKVFRVISMPPAEKLGVQCLHVVFR